MDQRARKFASVQAVVLVEPIDGADRIELARVLGWHVVVKKGEFKPGDLCVYFEIDSLLPEDNPDFDFLKNSKGRIKHLKTQKIRGVYSQGLVMPMDILDHIGYTGPRCIGTDVTDVLNVKKYSPEEIDVAKFPYSNPDKLGDFPFFIAKSDEMRIQAIPEVAAKLKDKVFVATEKLDGTSFTAFIRDGEVGICSRNMQIKLDSESDNIYNIVAKKYNLEGNFKELRESERIPYDFAIQGEIIGPGIQKNRYKLAEPELYLFDYWNIEKQRDIGFYADDEEKSIFADINLETVSKMLAIPHVPIIDSNFKMTDDVDALVAYSIDKSVLNKDAWREGVVYRAKYNSECTKYDNRVSFKAINPEFLVK